MLLVYSALDSCELNFDCLGYRTLLHFHPSPHEKATDADGYHHHSAAIAAALKLKIMFDSSDSRGDRIERGYMVMIWSIVEHGLSIFASSVLALRPMIKLIPKRWTTLLSSLYKGGSAKSSGQGSSTHTPRKSNWSDPTESNELAGVGARNGISVRPNYTVECYA